MMDGLTTLEALSAESALHRDEAINERVAAILNTCRMVAHRGEPFLRLSIDQVAIYSLIGLVIAALREMGLTVQLKNAAVWICWDQIGIEALATTRRIAQVAARGGVLI